MHSLKNFLGLGAVVLLTILDQAGIWIEGPDKRKIMVQNDNLFPAETSEGLFLVRAVPNC